MVYTVVEEEPFKINKENDVYVVEGSWAKKIVASTNFTDYESLQYFQRALKRKGIIDELEKMGINEGIPLEFTRQNLIMSDRFKPL